MASRPPRRPTPLAGGIFIALGMIGGVFIGIALRQPSAGMVIGLALGTAVAVAVWLTDRRRAG